MDSRTLSSDSFEKDGNDDKEHDTENKEANSSDEKENQRDDIDEQALIDELEKIESEMRSLRTVMTAKQKRANEIKSILGNPIVNDVKEKLKSIQDSEAIQKTNQAFKSAGEKTSAAFSTIGKRFGDVRAKIGVSIGSSINNVKKSRSLFALPSESRMNNGSRSDEDTTTHHRQSTTSRSDSLTASTIDEEDISLYQDLDDSPYD